MLHLAHAAPIVRIGKNDLHGVQITGPGHIGHLRHRHVARERRDDSFASRRFSLRSCLRVQGRDLPDSHRRKVLRLSASPTLTDVSTDHAQFGSIRKGYVFAELGAQGLDGGNFHGGSSTPPFNLISRKPYCFTIWRHSRTAASGVSTSPYSSAYWPSPHRRRVCRTSKQRREPHPAHGRQ